jgi:integrase
MGVGRLQPSRVRQTAHREAEKAAGYPAGRSREGHRAGPRQRAERGRALRLARRALYVWLVAITGVRRGELCGVQIRDIDLDNGWLHVAYNYVVKGGQKIRKDTKTHQDRYPAIDPVTCALIREHLDAVAAALADTGVKLAPSAYLFSNHPANTRPWNPDWASHRVADLAAAAGVELNIKALRHYTASQLLAAGFDLGNTAARLGHSGGGATTLKHYADPISEVDRRAAAYLAQLTVPQIGEQPTLA